MTSTTAQDTRHRAWIRLGCLMLGGLFVWAALSKMANPTAFLGTLYAYELPLPDGLLKFAAVALPWVELLSGLMLLAAWWTETALVLVAGMLAVFVVATAQAWWRGLEIACGCFDLSFLGIGEESGLGRLLESPGFALVRNLVLAGITGWLVAAFRPFGFGGIRGETGEF